MAAFMDDLVIDPVSGEQISSRHSVVLPIVKDISDVSEYVKSVGNLIGANNIRSAYKVEGRVKIYLRYAKHVDELVSSGVRLRGHFTSVEYSVLPATRVLLKNVDTEIPNRIISSKLEVYGKVSPISTLKANIADPEYSHIESNERQAFMLVNSGLDIPSKLEIFYKNKLYVLDVHVQKPDQSVESTTSMSESLVAPSSTSTLDDKEEINEAKPYIYVLPPESTQLSDDQQQPKRVFQRGRGLKHVSRRGYRRGGGGGKGTVIKISQSPRSSLSSSLKKIVKAKRGGGRGRRGFRRGSVVRSRALAQDEVESSVDVEGVVGDSIEVTQSKETEPMEECQEESNSSRLGLITNVKSAVDDSSIEGQNLLFLGGLDRDNSQQSSTSVQNGINGSPVKLEINEDLKQHPFSHEMLERFLREVKNHRNPMDVALNLLEENDTPGATNDLCNQLIEFFNCTSDTATRVRLSRLVYLISGGRKTL